jgi:nucleotide-binding universal stress UspA family protein
MPQNNILVPIDFSEQSHIALGQSYNLAKYTGSTITLLHIYRSSEQDAQGRLDKLAQEVSTQSGLKANTMIVKGKMHEQIIKVAEKINAIVIIMGFNSSKGMIKIIERSACPVITIKGKDHHNGCKHIVLPLDMTDATREKVSKAVEFAKFFNSTIYVISVRLHKEKRHEKKMIAYAHQVQKFIKEKGVPCFSKTLEGEDIAKLVLDYAHEIKADLLMIMSQKEFNLKNIFVGTTAQRIVELAEVPVLSIRPMRRKSVARF